MTIAVGILGAVLGIIIGALVMHLKAVKQVSEAKNADAELEKNAAVLQSQLDAAEKALDTAKTEAAQQISQVKDEAARHLAEVRSENEKALAMAKSEAAQALAAAKGEAAKALEQAKNEAANTLAKEKEAAEKRLESMKQDLEQVHQKSLDDQKDRFDDISKKLVAEAKNATEEMVKLREKQITESGHATMEQLVNPLKETIAKPDVTLAEAIENIDIGGPAMVRASAKNFKFVTIVTNPAKYNEVIAQIKENGGVDDRTRMELAQEAFAHTAAYDTMIQDYLAKQLAK